MKKLMALIIALGMVFSAMTAFAADIKVVVNGEEMAFDREPMVENGVVFIPYRFVAEKLGAKISWHHETKTVFGEYEGKIITAQIGNNFVFVNDGMFTVENAPIINTDRTMVPLDVFVNGYGADASWDSEASVVTIKK